MLTFREDDWIVKNRISSQRARLDKVLPRLTVICFASCMLVLAVASTWLDLEPKIWLVGTLLPTPFMIILLVLISRFGAAARQCWKAKDGVLVMQDGFFIPVKCLSKWSVDIRRFRENSLYQTITLSFDGGMRKSITMKETEEIDSLLRYLCDGGVNKTE